MKLGLFTMGYQRNPLEDAFFDARDFGYDYVELWGGRPHAFAPDLKNGEMDNIKNLIQKYSMPVKCYTPETNAYPYNMMIGTEQMRKDCIEYICLCMDMAKEMGADFTLISAAHAGYDVDGETIWKRLIKCLRELTDHAEKIGHKIILEALTPYESNVCTSANHLKSALSEIDSAYLSGMCDIVAPFVVGESIMAYMDKLGDKMEHFHIVDSDGSSDTHVLPGDGKMPLDEVLYAIKKSGFNKTATIELVTAYMNEPRFYSRKAINRVKALMKE